MSNERFTKDHEWLRLNDDGSITVGITDFAQDQLGDIVFVELPDEGDKFEADTEMAIIESVKAAGDIKIPIAGEVINKNMRLIDEPELVNGDPVGEGWFVKIAPENIDDLNGLMDDSEYKNYLKDL